MFMHRMKELQEVLDLSDPFLLEACSGKTVLELLEIKQRDMKYREIAVQRYKPTTEIDKRIASIDALVEMKGLVEALKDHDEMMDGGQPVVPGISLT